ncbi:MAG: hypothetical protein LUQ26_09965 [Methylococcaceae bacterium]|nr:hypothetical protein [Methylococcaceae bacterium]
MTNEEIEREILDKGLTAPRVTLEGMRSKISRAEILTTTVSNGQIIRTCILIMENGYVVVGKPSCCVSPENDNEELGGKIAEDSAIDELWALEGYLLKEKLYQASLFESLAGEAPIVYPNARGEYDE